MSESSILEALLERQQGVVKLTPTYARRLYRDGGRLSGGKPGSTYIPREGMWLPERWIASGTEAMNPNPIAGEGLSRLDLNPFGSSGSRAGSSRSRAGLTGSHAGSPRSQQSSSGSHGKSRGLQPARSRRPARSSNSPSSDEAPTLLDAFRQAGEQMLGAARYRAHGPEFRVLIKILDGDTPIVFHFHADDAAVTKYPKHFAGHRFGKDEAYYFLDRPKSRCPYTHVGLRPGTSPEELAAAVAAGSERTLELSPVFLQTWEEGFFVPAGVVHRPGSALTLEIQQPSDVYTLLEDHMEDATFTPEQMHPGFKSLEASLKFVDMKTSTDRDILKKFRLVPSGVGKRLKGAVEDWIFPQKVCRKFSGTRLRVTGRTVTVEPECYAVLVWKGEGRFGPHAVRGGDEFFVTHEAARKGVAIERTGGEYLELFKFFAAPV